MVRIQLSSNYQVVELTYDTWDAVNRDEVSAATELVNELGLNVNVKTVNGNVNATVQTSRRPPQRKPGYTPATRKQLDYLDSLGIPYEDGISKQEAWRLTQEYSGY